MASTLEDRDWDILLRRIKDKKCTPFIGAGASAGTLPLGSQIAKQWASLYQYPLRDSEDLARVAQYLAVARDDMFPKEDIQQQFENVSHPDYSRRDEPHALLADLKLPIYITTNYDSFMTLALENRGRNPVREFCRWNRFFDLGTAPAFESGYTPSQANPLVYHLHGHYEFPQSIVLTEDDYLDFLVHLSSDHELLPAPVRTALAGTSMLFIGYSLSDWNFRVLFRGLIGSLGASLGYTSIAVQLSPPSADDSDAGRANAKRYLDLYFEKIHKIKVRVYWGDIKEFCLELRERWEKVA